MKINDSKLEFNIYKMPLTKCARMTFNQESISWLLKCYILQMFPKEMSLYVYSNGYQRFFFFKWIISTSELYSSELNDWGKKR